MNGYLGQCIKKNSKDYICSNISCTVVQLYICVLFAGLFSCNHPCLCYVEMVAAFRFRGGNIIFMTNQMVILKMIASAENSGIWLEWWEI